MILGFIYDGGRQLKQVKKGDNDTKIVCDIKDGTIKVGKKYYSAGHLKVFSVILYILGVLWILMGLPVMPLGVIFLLFGIFCLWMGRSYSILRKILMNSQSKSAIEQSRSDVSETATNSTDRSTSAEMLEPNVKQSHSTYPFKDDDGRILRYSYYDVEVKGFDHQNFDIKKLELEKFVTFDFEPDNQYDPNAIAIFYDDQKIGYVPQNSLQSMVKKYSDGKEHQICGFISCINEDLNEVQIALGFYSKVNNDLDVFKCRLCKTRAKDFMGNSRQENLELVDTGCPVDLEYNDESETYLVCDDTGAELGEISKKQSAQIYDVIGDTEPFHAEVSELDTDDDDKIICTIEVWIK